MDLLYGKLIWTEYSRNRANKDSREIQNDKNMTAELKQLCLDDIDTFLDLTTEASPAFTHVSSTSTDDLYLSATNVALTPKTILSNWKASLLEEDFGGFTQRLRRQSRNILTYLKSLRFEDFPDYSLLKDAFAGMLLSPNSIDCVGSPEYSRFGFSWTIACGTHESSTVGSATASIASVTERDDVLKESSVVRLLSKQSSIQNIIVAKGKYLGRQINKALSKSSISDIVSRSSIAKSAYKPVNMTVALVKETEQPSLKRVKFIQTDAKVLTSPINSNAAADISMRDIGGMITELDESEFETSIEHTAFTGVSSIATLTRKSSFTDFDQVHDDVEEPRNAPNINIDIDTLLSEVAASVGCSGANLANTTNPLVGYNTKRRRETVPHEASKAPRVDISFGITWKSLVEELMTRLSSDQVRRETVDLFENLLRDFHRFYYFKNSTGDSSFTEADWLQFVDIQKVKLRWLQLIAFNFLGLII